MLRHKGQLTINFVFPAFFGSALGHGVKTIIGYHQIVLWSTYVADEGGHSYSGFNFLSPNHDTIKDNQWPNQIGGELIDGPHHAWLSVFVRNYYAILSMHRWGKSLVLLGYIALQWVLILLPLFLECIL